MMRVGLWFVDLLSAIWPRDNQVRSVLQYSLFAIVNNPRSIPDSAIKIYTIERENGRRSLTLSLMVVVRLRAPQPSERNIWGGEASPNPT
jgi:hypothetical protein